ncbi:hypothetical protein OHD62_19525 [Mesorhizobium sp. YC-39]|uniref:hypothetical protein n=1 Tax=unclassified Mesorhizobium TaxID=325217 RepID=UPI0021E7AEEA|nr:MULTISPECIES: hypothetical protein [unclassified Mesorhizobium]MCV3210035.1 hypothetical protein [Mesorhizobium sp. YC-2]MCV3230565.1 hypothetical protein [Mesorhizobium sp. YC-39]
MFGRAEPGSRSNLAVFIEKHAKLSNLDYTDLGIMAGYSNANMIHAFIEDQAKLPLDRVPALAYALGCDGSQLLGLCLERHFKPEMLSRVRLLFVKDITANERAWLAALQEASGEPDPEVTEERSARLKKIFT